MIKFVRRKMLDGRREVEMIWFNALIWGTLVRISILRQLYEVTIIWILKYYFTILEHSDFHLLYRDLVLLLVAWPESLPCKPFTHLETFKLQEIDIPGYYKESSLWWMISPRWMNSVDGWTQVVHRLVRYIIRPHPPQLPLLHNPTANSAIPYILN